MTPKWKPELLTFDADSHSYTYDGKLVPNVTSILETVGITKPYDGDPWYGERGTAVHLACEYLDQGALDWGTVDEQIKPYVLAWDTWRRESGFKTLHSEIPVCNPELNYAGTLDRIGELYGITIILDIKTGQRSRATGIQLAMYAMCFNPKVLRYALHLSATEPAKLIEYADPLDYEAAHAAATIMRWKGAGKRGRR